MKFISLLLSIILLSGCQTAGISVLDKPNTTSVFPDGKYRLVSSDEKKKLPDFMSNAEIKTINGISIIDMGEFKFIQQWQMIGDSKIIELKYIGDGESKLDVDAFLYFKVDDDKDKYIIRPIDKKSCRKIYNELSGGNKDIKIFEEVSEDGKSKSSITVSSVKDQVDVALWKKSLLDPIAFDNVVIECIRQ